MALDGIDRLRQPRDAFDAVHPGDHGFRWLRAGVDALARIIQCAVTRRYSSAGANPARQLSLQPVAVGADDGGNDIG